MRNGRKKLSIIGVMLLLVMMLSGCTGQNATNEADNQTTNDSSSLESYDITLDPNGGVFPDGSSDKVTLTVQEGQAIDFSQYNAQSEGNDLRGWYYAEDTHKPWPGARKVDNNVSLIAKWSQEEIQEVYELGIFVNDESIPLMQDSGVYQFTVVSSIHHGYAQRSAKYTVYLDELKDQISQDDGSEPRALYVATSSYVDASGLIYAEFYNDGTFELFYDYTYNGEHTKYSMDYGVWTLDGYTPQIEAPAALPEEQEGTTVHDDYDRTLLGDTDPDIPKDTSGEKPDIVTLPGETFYEVDSTNSETMKLHFKSNNVMTIYMTTYDTDVETKYQWSYSERSGLSVLFNNDPDNKAVLSEDGDTITLVGSSENTYEFSLADFLSQVPDMTELYIADASNTETMKLFFYPEKAVRTMYDLTAYGRPGEYSPTAYGQWEIQEDGTLNIFMGGQPVGLTESSEGVYECTLADNTYVITLSDLMAAAQ